MYFPADFKKYPVYEDIAQLSSLSWGCSWYIMATCLGYSSGITGSIYSFWYLTFSLYILWFWIFMWPIEKKLWFCSWHILTALSKYCSIFLEFCLVGMLPASLNRTLVLLLPEEVFMLQIIFVYFSILCGFWDWNPVLGVP